MKKTNEITWHLKVYSTETIAIIKDTDKEDREKALKASWEQNEPGRAEKAKKSRQKYLLQLKQNKGEELTEEELAIVNEVRERVRKKDEPVDQPKGGKPAGKAPPKGKEPPKGKGAAAANTAAVTQEDESKN